MSDTLPLFCVCVVRRGRRVANPWCPLPGHAEEPRPVDPPGAPMLTENDADDDL